MPERTYDAVIVGGRCAGASLAARLARNGASVIVLEADRLGTDQVISTHTIHPGGMDMLDELGVGDAVREHAPPAKAIRFQVDGSYIDVKPPPGRHECCPRRYRLDGLLQQAAVDAGAEVCEKTRVTDLRWDGERVVGVRARRNGSEIEVRGAVTVGADGRHSTVAQLAGAEEYLDYDSPRGAYWAYWDPPASWREEQYPFDFLLEFTEETRHAIFSTDDGQILIATLPIMDDARMWKGDHTERYLDDLRAAPVLRPLADEGTMASPVLGTVSERYFFRRSAGPGWALVGDAGHHKDLILGWGISEALEQSKHLAAAIEQGGDMALERYWRARDVEALPRFRLAEERGAPGRMNPLFPLVMSKVPETPGLADRLFSETEFDVNPYEVMPVGKVAAWTFAAALRGRPALIGSLIAQARRAMSVQREVDARQKLLDEVPEAAQPSRVPS